jgi:hypothetical protein
MGKQGIYLKLRDMYAIKHALQSVVNRKTMEVNALQLKENIPENYNRIKMLLRDIQQEEWLIQKMIKEIDHFEISKKIR